MARRIVSTGDKVEGSRKDRWRERALGLADLDGLSAREAEEFVTKETVWPQPDYEALVAGGTPREVAALLKVIRDKVATAPSQAADARTRAPRDISEARRDYVRVLSAAQAALADARTVADVEAGCRIVMNPATHGAKDRYDPDYRNLVLQAFRDRYGPFQPGGAERKRAKALVEEGWPAKTPAWRKGLTTGQDREGLWRAVKARRVVASGFATEAALLAHMEGLDRDRRAGKGSGPKAPPARAHLDAIERTGLPDVRGGAPVEPEAFNAAFGFRYVEFGEWLPDSERRRVLELGYDALSDLASAIGIAPGDVGFGELLSAAFGSRGNGGNAVATYNPTYRIYNLTRLRGAGALAHEFGHALDDLAGLIGSGAEGRFYASGGDERVRRIAARLPGLPARAAEAWETMMRVLHERPLTRDEAAARQRESAAAYRGKAADAERMVAEHNERNPTRPDVKWLRKAAAFIAEREVFAKACEAKAAEYEAAPEGADFGVAETDFLREAKLLGKDYPKPVELFARAFETMVHDVLAARGGRSDYLVYGVEAERYADKELFTGNPYPVGAERERIVAAMSDLCAAMAGPIAAFSEARRAARAEGPGDAPATGLAA